MKAEKRSTPQPQQFQPYELVIRIDSAQEDAVVKRAVGHYLRTHAWRDFGSHGQETTALIHNALMSS